MKAWRLAEGLSLIEVAKLLNNQVSQPTLSRWEQSQKEIPKWASDIFFGVTTVSMPLAELHALLDQAKIQNKSFRVILAEAIREWIAKHEKAASQDKLGLAAEDPTEYRTD